VAGALAAACLLAALAWPRRAGTSPVPAKGDSAHQVTPRTPDDSASLAALVQARRALDSAELPPFTWPLGETAPVMVATAIPHDLLD
jgi:hypothetical protein